MPPAGPEYRSTGVTCIPRTASGAAAPKSERVVITSDQLVAAVQGKLQAAAEKAVQTAINSHLTDAVRQSLSKMDEVCKTSINQIEQHSQERLEVMMRTAREEMMSQHGSASRRGPLAFGRNARIVQRPHDRIEPAP